VLGFGFWVLGFGFWVLGFGFWVLGFGFWVLPWWSIPVSFPAGTDLLFFVLPKKSKQKKGAPEMATPPLGFVSRGGEGAKLAALRQGSFLDPPRNKNPRRHLGLNVKRKRPTRREVGLCRLGLRFDGLAFVL
ncbi:hypothetical protein, partial [Ralstonia edaphi]|uniref:hypothetical protein n=1 Tax=Ralstonia edaphi TaxID=3058599 RepID=UPI00292D0F1B